MITIEYTKEGEAVSDFGCDDYVNIIRNDILDGENSEYDVSTSIVILAIRAAIARGELDFTKIQFKFDDHILHPDKDGRMEYWPRGFCDIDLNFMDDILNNFKQR
jgi:hypothetical protein